MRTRSKSRVRSAHAHEYSPAYSILGITYHIPVDRCSICQKERDGKIVWNKKHRPRKQLDVVRLT